MDDLEKFLDELRDALLGSEVISSFLPSGMRNYVRPAPSEADRMVNVVREMFRHGDWQLVVRGKKS